MLCISCHAKYDHDEESHKIQGKASRDWKHSEEAKKKIGLASILRKSGFKKDNIPWNKKDINTMSVGTVDNLLYN